jgi:hypothetical protein
MANLSDSAADGGVPGELKDLASNLLVASPSLFDDPTPETSCCSWTG